MVRDRAFKNHILTGAVINSNHIELRQFLEDAGNVILERVRNAIERHGSKSEHRVQWRVRDEG